MEGTGTRILRVSKFTEAAWCRPQSTMKKLSGCSQLHATMIGFEAGSTYLSPA